MTPQRIQLKRTKGWRKPPNTIVVSRPSKWGNPYAVGESFPTLGDAALCKDNAHAVRMFRLYVSAADKAPEIRRELRGKNLACWCKPGDPCHADVLLEIANA